MGVCSETVFKQRRTLVIKEWEKDHIYLVQLPRCGCTVSISTFSVKLETWLRFAKLPYTNVSNKLTIGSCRNQIPFIELNGEQHTDTENIIQMLKRKFPVRIDERLNSAQLMEARMMRVFVEESLHRVITYYYAYESEWMETSNGFIDNFTGIKRILFKYYLSGRLRKHYRKVIEAQGIGRRPVNEIEEIAVRDLEALTVRLGVKRFMFGDKPSSVDAAIYGVLSVLYSIPKKNLTIANFFTKTSSLLRYIERIRKSFWRDHDALCMNLAMNLPQKSDEYLDTATDYILRCSPSY